MRILIVEDDVDFADFLSEIANILDPAPTVSVCRSTASALALLDSAAFDLVILDRRLPTSDDAMDAEVEHGTVVYEYLRSSHQGTPICFVTGYPTSDFLLARINDAENVDVWGNGLHEPLIQVIPKSDGDSIADVLRHHAREVEECRNVEVDSPHALALSYFEKRAVRIFARRAGCYSAEIRQLSGGLSGMRVLRVTFKDQAGTVSQTCVARIGAHVEIREEYDAYMQHVVRLPNGSYAALNGTVFHGTANKAGIFYTLIPNFTSLLAILQRDEHEAVRIVGQLRTNSLRWTSNRPQISMTVAELRRLLLKDADLTPSESELDGLRWRELERSRVQVALAAQHGDLHSENVLVAEGRPILIDYGRVGIGPACLDPLMLELAFLFHPACKRVVGDWPSREHVSRWGTIDEYVAACPYKLFLKAIREWAVEASQGKRSLYATTYAIAVRQLKFPSTDRSLIRALIDMSILAIETDT
jgi:CheY-like chemotaxis protein